MISFLPAIIWLILLLVLSSQNGPQTAATSLPMAEWIQQHFFPQDSVDGVHMYLRKWAHFIVYFIESGLLVLAMKNVMKAWKAACAVFGLCTILAIADEAHKVLIVGRHCQWDEAGINIVGVIMGVLLTWSILWLIRWARGTLEDQKEYFRRKLHIMTSGRQAVKGEIGRWFLGILSVFLVV